MCKTTDWKDNKSFVGERVLTGSTSTDDEHLQGKTRRSGGLGVNGAAGSQARRNRPVAARSNVEEEAEAEAEGGADESGEDT